LEGGAWEDDVGAGGRAINAGGRVLLEALLETKVIG